MVGDRADFFVSHAGADRAWAEWVAWQLADAGYTVELAVWDWAAGQNAVLAMSDALARADRVLAVFSAAYFDRSRYTTEEWTAALVHGPGREQGRLVPVRVENVPVEDMPDVLRPLVFCDLFGLDAAEARRVLLAAVKGPPGRVGSRCSQVRVRRVAWRSWGVLGRGCRGACRGSGMSRRATRGLPAGTIC
jgi:TIR domain